MTKYSKACVLMLQIPTSKEIHPSWMDFLNPERIQMLAEIAQKVGDRINPNSEYVLRFLQTDLSEVKVIILGQDPYPQQGMATGRAFEVGGLESWHQSFRQVSLKNIVRLLHKDYWGITRYEDIHSFTMIKQEMKQGKFPILPPNALFSSWERQGVLLLNTSFTCIPGIPGSHEGFWKAFTKELLGYLSANPRLHWFLWGKHACEKMACIQSGIVHASRHPMLCSSKYPDDFLKSDCFLATGHLIQWLG